MFDLTSLGKWTVIAGLVAVVVGAGVWLAGRVGLPLGRLPGDVRLERGGVTVFFPCATSIILSIVLTILLNVVLRLLRR
jgi:hypothetical protein